jgi:hypothetical protein
LAPTPFTLLLRAAIFALPAGLAVALDDDDLVAEVTLFFGAEAEDLVAFVFTAVAFFAMQRSRDTFEKNPNKLKTHAELVLPTGRRVPPL